MTRGWDGSGMREVGWANLRPDVAGTGGSGLSFKGSAPTTYGRAGRQRGLACISHVYPF